MRRRLPEHASSAREPGSTSPDEIVLRRVVQSSGRSRAYLNGRLCTAAQLSELASELVDISSQHQSVALTDPATHLVYLDAFAKLDTDRSALAVVVDELVARSKKVAELEEIERGRGEREAFLRFQLASIEEVNPEAGEVALLEAERGRLRHAERLGRVTRSAAERLYDKDNAICDELARLAGELGSMASSIPALSPLSRRCRIGAQRAGRCGARARALRRRDRSRSRSV